MATLSAPLLPAWARNACRSSDSGVVIVEVVMGTDRSSIRSPNVPTVATDRPNARRPAWSRKTVLVFPLVPVTPAMNMRSAGRPKMVAAISAIAARGSSTTRTGTPHPSASVAPTASVTIAHAPAATAEPANDAPWVRCPGRAT
jgi:hypothetical protein